MIKKNLLITILSVIACSSIYSMDFEQKRQLQTSDGKTVLCDVKLCKLSTTIAHVMENLEDFSTAIPLPKVTEKIWNMLKPFLQAMIQGNVAGINYLLQLFDLGNLTEVLNAAEYLDIRTTDEKIILVDFISKEIARRLLTEDSLNRILNNEISLNDLGLSEILSKKVASKVMELRPNVKERLLQKSHVQSKVLNGHDHFVTSAAFNRTGERIVSASMDKTVRIWDVQTGKCEKILQGHNSSVNSAAFNRTGERIVSASHDKTVRIWDVKTGKCERVLNGHTDSVYSAGYNQTGDKIVSASADRTVRIWDVKTGKCERIFTGHTGVVYSAEFNPTGDKIVSASFDGTVRIWDVKTDKCERVLKGHTDWVMSARFNRTGERIVSASRDGTVRIWDVKTGKCEKIFPHDNSSVNSAELNQIEDTIVSASGDDHKVIIWDAKTGNCGRIFKGHTIYAASARFNQTGDKIVSASSDRTVRIWDLKDLLACQDYLENNLTLDQALLLVCQNRAVDQNTTLDISKKPYLKEVFDTVVNQEIKDAVTNTGSRLSRFLNNRITQIAIVLPVMVLAGWYLLEYLKRK